MELLDQFYKYLVSPHRWVTELVLIVLIGAFIHFGLNFLAGRASEGIKAPQAQGAAANSTGDGSPSVSNPTGAVTIHSEVRK